MVKNNLPKQVFLPKTGELAKEKSIFEQCNAAEMNFTN